MGTTVFYWHQAADAIGDQRVASIYFLGNPVVWWGAGGMFVVFIGSVAWRGLRLLGAEKGNKTQNSKLKTQNLVWIPVLGFVIAFLPLVRVPRALFLYHYLTPLLFMILAVVIWLDGLRWMRPGGILHQPRSYFVVFGLVLAGFFIFSPLTYGFLLPPGWHDALFWLPGWR